MKEDLFWNRIYTPRNRVIAHLLFWAAHTYLLYTLYIRADFNFKYHLMARDLFSVISIFYLTAYFAIPRWFLTGKVVQVFLWIWGCYFWNILLTYFICIYVNIHFNPGTSAPIKRFVDSVIENGWYAGILPNQISYYLPDFALMVALPVGLKLSQSFVLQAIRKAKLERDNLTLELNLLKSQINPHFLFNSLNNIHRMVNKSDPRTGDTVLSLASLMRYTLYESNDPFVPLQDELKFLQNYIDLQRLRYGDRVDIQVDLPWVDEGFKIAPLILFPFIENAFKHGPDKSQKEAWVHIILSLDDNTLSCMISNNAPVRTRSEEVGGLGVENSKRRLELNYKGNYKLDIKHTEREHRVELAVQLQFHPIKYVVGR